MIALCQEHHDKADAGAFTRDQLREFKEQGAARAGDVRGRFDWLRRDLVAIVGGNVYYDTPIIFHYNNQPVIWFRRDEDGYMLLNVRMLSKLGEPRAVIADNFWLKLGSPEDLESPPSGKLLSIKYPNGDSLKVEFFNLDSPSAAEKRMSSSQVAFLQMSGASFPLTAVEVHNKVADMGIHFTPTKTSIGGGIIKGSGFARGVAAIVVGPDDNIPSNYEDRWRYASVA